MRKQIIYILIFFSLSTQSQVFEWRNPIIKFRELKIKFDGLSISANLTDTSKTENEKVKLHLELGETTQGILLSIFDSDLKNIVIQQKYETSLTISNEGPHVDLLDWKHHTSEWQELKSIADNNFRTYTYDKEQQELFPEFTEKELIEYLEKIGYSSYAKLIEKPRYGDGSKHYWIGLSIVSFKITGTDSMGNQIEKRIDFKIPMGC